MGRYSIIAVYPFEKITSKGTISQIETIVRSQESGQIKKIDRAEYTGNPFKLLREKMEKYQTTYTSELPFIGGAVGYFGYDLCHHMEKIDRTAVDDVKIPDLYLCMYDGAIIIDHKEKALYVTDAQLNDGGETRVDRIVKVIEASQENPPVVECVTHETKPEFTPNMTKDYYLSTIRK